MRRFSQRSALVTLSEINITPLLEQSIPLTLPKGGKPDPKIELRDIRTVEISLQGGYKLNRQPMAWPQIQLNLVKDFQANPNIVVYIRADEKGLWGHVAAVMDFCQQRGIKMSARMQPPKK